MFGHCCPKCFGDAFLAEQISDMSEQLGVCPVCLSAEVPIVRPADVTNYFQQVADLYVEDEAGERISILMKKDWGLFNILCVDDADSLIASIFDDDIYRDKFFSNQLSYLSTEVSNWELFREELKHRNRYFPKAVPDAEKLNNLFYLFDLASYPIVEQRSKLFRARINIDVDKYGDEQMGRPPDEKVTAGRANPVGISYLYVASNEKTAVSEVRPHKGEVLTVAEFKVTEPLRLLDLRDPRKRLSPFIPKDDDLQALHEGLEFLCRLGDELTKPVVRHKAHLEYLPSQYLCEAIKHMNVEDKEKGLVNAYDGVIYKSSVGDGGNYAIFDDSKIVIDNVYMVEITETDLSFENC